MEVNEITLNGTLAALEPLRYTPAGIPLSSFRLLHRSRQLEAGVKRQVECELAGVAMADVALAMSALGVGAVVRIGGFLDRKNRMSTQLVLHAVTVEQVAAAGDN